MVNVLIRDKHSYDIQNVRYKIKIRIGPSNNIYEFT